MIQSGKWYISSNSDLIVRINQIFVQTETHIQANISIFNKKHGYFYETNTYKLAKNFIKNWKECNKISFM